jgi:hypothetical protein
MFLREFQQVKAVKPATVRVHTSPESGSNYDRIADTVELVPEIWTA